MIEVGKLYRCSEYFLMLYPDKDTAAAAVLPIAAPSTSTSGSSYCNPLTPLLVLSVNEKYVEVLAGDKKGWIINMDWLEIKEIINEAA